MAIFRLGKGASRKIHSTIDDLFDNAKARLLGPHMVTGKRVWITFDRHLSLPGIYEAGAREEGIKPDMDTLNALIRVTSAYVDSYRERTKARVIHEINGALAQVQNQGGMAREDFRDLVNVKLADVWKDVTASIHTVVDTEVAHTKNVSVMEGVVGVNLAAGIEDPVVYFVVVKDNLLCKECSRLHLMEDGKTPRLWYLSEVGHGYHKRGEENPKIGGLHPHCRCTLVTLLPGYGFTADGQIKFVKRGYMEIAEQRNFALSMDDLFGEPLVKWDPEDHPRDEGGEFVEVNNPKENTFEEDPDLEARFEAETATSQSEEIEFAVREIREMIADGMVENTPEAVKNALMLMHAWPDDTTGNSLLERLDVLEKGEPTVNRPPSLFAKRIARQALADHIRQNLVADVPKRYPSLWNILYMYKYHPNNRPSQFLRYLIHRIENATDYLDPAKSNQLDKDFDEANMKIAKFRDEEKLHVPVYTLRFELGRNAHVIDDLMDHRNTLHKHLIDNGHTNTINGEPHVTLHRALKTSTRLRDPLMASYSDSENISIDAAHPFYHHVPLKNIWYSFNFGPEEAWKHPRRKTEDEFLVSPHNLKHAKKEHLKPVVPPKEKAKVKKQPVAGARLQKTLLSVPVGERQNETWAGTEKFDYSHLLTPEHRAAGLRLHLYHDAPYYAEPRSTIKAHIVHESVMSPEEIADWEKGGVKVPSWVRVQTKNIGEALGFVHPDDKTLEPHFNSGVHKDYRGQGLGKALYTAVFGHAYNALGARTVKGNYHSRAAGKIHEALSRQHGMNYQTFQLPRKHMPEKNAELLGRYAPGSHARGPYQYDMKNELKPSASPETTPD